MSTYQKAQSYNAMNTPIPETADRTANSLFDIVHVLEDHVHSCTFLDPEDSLGNVVTTGVGAYAYGAYAEFVAASARATDFDYHFLSIADVSASDTYIIEISHGAGDTVAALKKLTLTSPFADVVNVPMMSLKIPANDRVRVRVKSATGGSKTVTMTLEGHPY